MNKGKIVYFILASGFCFGALEASSCDVATQTDFELTRVGVEKSTLIVAAYLLYNRLDPALNVVQKFDQDGAWQEADYNVSVRFGDQKSRQTISLLQYAVDLYRQSIVYDAYNIDCENSQGELVQLMLSHNTAKIENACSMFNQIVSNVCRIRNISNAQNILQSLVQQGAFKDNEYGQMIRQLNLCQNFVHEQKMIELERLQPRRRVQGCSDQLRGFQRSLILISQLRALIYQKMPASELNSLKINKNRKEP